MKKRFSSPQLILFITSATFFCYGIFNAGVGPVLEEFSTHTAASLAVVGTIFTALYAGSLLAQFGSGSLTDRYGRKPVFIISIFLFGAGILGMVYSRSMTAFLVCGFITGLGQGGLDLGANLIAAETYPRNNVAALNIVHLAFGVGAAIGPALVSLSLKGFDAGMPVLLGSALLFLFLGVSFFPIRLITSENAAPVEGTPAGNTSDKSVYRSPLLWMFGGLLLLVVGAQFGIGSWSSIYMTKTTAYSLETAAMVTSGFWLMITVGRVISAAMSKWIIPRKMLLIHLIASLASVILFALSRSHGTLTVITLLLTGLCYGGLYPLVFSLAAAAFPVGSGKAASIVIALGTVGGLILPPLAGLLLENVSAAAYTGLPVAAISMMLVLYFLITIDKGSAFGSGKSKPTK